MNSKLPVIGFIGTGTLTTALVTGFCTRAADVPYPIIVSPRSIEKSAMLRARYPDRVTVADSMQEIVDRSDWIILAVLPDAGEAVCRNLCFSPKHKIINVMFDKTTDQIASWINCKVTAILHMIPLTVNASVNGPIVLCPPNEEAAEIFGHIGRIVPVEERHQAAVFGAITACEASMYAILDALNKWAQSEGVDAELASSYISSFFSAVCELASHLDSSTIHTLATTSTPGGINMQNLAAIDSVGGFQAWTDAIRAVFLRVIRNTNESDNPVTDTQ